MDGSNGGMLAVLGNVTGSATLAVNVAHFGVLDLAGTSNEVGAVTITGADPTQTGINAGTTGALMSAAT